MSEKRFDDLKPGTYFRDRDDEKLLLEYEAWRLANPDALAKATIQVTAFLAERREARERAYR